MTDLQYASDDACRAAFAHMQARAPVLARTTATERIAKLRRLHQAVYDLRAEIGQVGREELGSDGRAQLIPVPQAIAYVAQNLEGWMRPVEIAPSAGLMGVRGYTYYEPKGVILHLSTWNAPFLISLSPMISMIAAGNAVVLKPSEVAPRAASMVEKIIAAAGLGDDVAVIQGGAETAQVLLKLPLNHVCYVGNNRVGRLVMQAAAENFADVTLEMGGKNPVIVAPDADLEDAAAKIVTGRLVIAGQACLSPDYVLVHESVKEALTAKMVEKITAFYDPNGKGIAASRDLARIINARHVARIKALIEDARAKGARLITGGAIDPEKRFISPTILDGITEGMEIFHEEVFGPVLTVHSWSSRTEVIAQIEKRPKPLGLYVFTQERDTADWFLSRTRAGSSAINSIASQATVPNLPFGGVNHSGIGQLNGEAGFREFSHARSVVEDALQAANRRAATYPPYPPGMESVFDMLLAVPPETISGTLSIDCTLEAILANPRGKEVVTQELPGIAEHPAFAMIKSMALKGIGAMSGGQLTDEMLSKVDAKLRAIA